MLACPYQSRSYLEIEEEKIRWPGSPLWKGEFRTEPQLLKKGTVSKCTFCRHRIDKAKETGKIPGKDHEATPMCVNSCVGEARYFGDLDDPDSEVSKLVRSRRAFRLHEGAGTKPSVYYLM
jgi:phenylacetyl-CoA:acceptor oxidoreductase subunit 1